jgi:hypothetical protein
LLTPGDPPEDYDGTTPRNVTGDETLNRLETPHTPIPPTEDPDHCTAEETDWKGILIDHVLTTDTTNIETKIRYQDNIQRSQQHIHADTVQVSLIQHTIDEAYNQLKALVLENQPKRKPQRGTKGRAKSRQKPRYV